jgi:predicted nucleic acid-binding protein
LFLIDTNVISEIRKGSRADAGAVEFLRNPEHEIFMPAQVIGELRRGVENVLLKRDIAQAKRLQVWFESIFEEFSSRILAFDADCAVVWGRLAGPGEQNLIDKQIASIAIVYDLTVVTRNTSDFKETGVRLLNPFSGLPLSASPKPSTIRRADK